MLSCRDIDLLLQDHLDGALLPSQEEVLERHLRACPDCRATLAGVSRVDARLEGLHDVEAPQDLSRRILAALPPDVHRPLPSPLRLALRYVAAPVLLAAVLAGAFILKGQFALRSARAGRELEIVFQAPAATSVAVVGDFNGWDPGRNHMVRASHEGIWLARLRLPPGTYQYAFVIDGKVWERDPRAQRFVDDGFGGSNSVVVVDG